MNAIKGFRSSLIRRFAVAALAVSISTPAFAHHGMGGQTPTTILQGLLSGLAHPVIGPDHLLFLIVSGVFVWMLDGAARYRAVAFLVAGQLLGTSIHLSAIGLPIVEAMIAVSVVVGGGLLLARRRPSAGQLAMLLVGAGTFHGYAFAESIVGAEATPLAAYLAGLALIQALVLVGISAALEAAERRSGAPLVARGQRLAGGIAVAGGTLLLALALS